MADVTDPNAAGGAQPQPGDAAAVPPSQPETDWKAQFEQAKKQAEEATKQATEAKNQATEWQKRAQGWQGAYQGAEQAKKSLDDQIKDLNARLTTAEDTMRAKIEEAGKLSTDLAAAQTEASKAKGKLERMTVVATEFPGLLDLEAKGLLPDKSGDELREALKVINSKIAASADGKINDMLNGASPTQPPPEKQKTAEELKKAAIQMVQHGKPQADIDAAWDAYYAVLPKGEEPK